MIELNLLPDVKKEFIKAQQTRNRVVSGAILVSIIAAGIVAFFATIVFIGQKVTTDKLTKEISSSHEELTKKDSINGYLTIQNQLSALDGVISSRFEYSRLFEFLAQLNPKKPNNITLYSVEIDKTSKVLKIDGSATNFEVVNNFKNTLLTATVAYKVQVKNGEAVTTESKEEPMFLQIISSQASLTTSGGVPATAFVFEVEYNTAAFDPANTEVAIKVPNLVTSDADKNAPLVFSDKPKDEEKPSGSQ